MNEQTTQLLEHLAIKLGTTTEYLWGVLLKQAPIDATITLIQTIFILLIGLILWKVHKKLLKKVPNSSYDENYYEKYDAGVFVPMVLIFIVWATMVIICFGCFGSIIYGYFNPEYWALKEIINSLK